MNSVRNTDRAETTRRHWLDVLELDREDRSEPFSEAFWSEKDTWTRERIREVQDRKVAAVAPFLYENSDFYRRRFDRLGLAPTDIRNVDDLIGKWPVIDKQEMMDDIVANPPYGTYSACSDEVWSKRGWMLFSSSGSTGVPRVFRYSHIDRAFWEQANARALHSGGIRMGDAAIPAVGFGPHVFAWGAQYTFAKMGLPVIPGGGLDGKARALLIDRFKPTVLVCTPSYALYLGRVMEEMGLDPGKSSIRALLSGGEPSTGVPSTRERIQDLWNARIIEFYGCTEVSPHCGGYSCRESQNTEHTFLHLLEDIQLWETVDPGSLRAVAKGERGLAVCTNLCSESSPQLRFLVGDYTTLDDTPCACGRRHLKAMGCFAGRADDLINLRGIKFLPSQIEQAVRAISGIGDEFQIKLDTRADGMDTMTVVIEHVDAEAAARVAAEIRTQCEVRADVEVLAPGTLPKTEFKARRVIDNRSRS
jgi:phenylacetate-CoA ligase